MAVGAIIEIDGNKIAIRNRLYSDTQELEEKIENNRKLALISSTIFSEIVRKMGKFVSDTIEDFKKDYEMDWKKINEVYAARVADEIYTQSCEKLSKILSCIEATPYNFSKAEKLQPEVLAFLNSYYMEYLKERSAKGQELHYCKLDRDAKIIADVIILRGELEKKYGCRVIIRFVTADSFLTNFPDTTKFVDKYKFNCFWPTDILKFI